MWREPRQGRKIRQSVDADGSDQANRFPRLRSLLHCITCRSHANYSSTWSPERVSTSRRILVVPDVPEMISVLRSRRDVLRRLAKLGAAGMLAPMLSVAPATASCTAAFPAQTANRNILICCNENRSFDHYFGKAPFVGAHGIPAGYSQPSGVPGINVPPVDLNSPVSPDPITTGAPSTAIGTTASSMVSSLRNYPDDELHRRCTTRLLLRLLPTTPLCELLLFDAGATFPNRLYLAGAPPAGKPPTT